MKASVDILIHYMPIILRAPGLSEWEREFCISAVGKINRGAWEPSDKQIAVMQRLHDKFLDEAMRDPLAGYDNADWTALPDDYTDDNDNFGLLE